jgi:Tfp pilus assembly protein PilF
MLKNHYQGRFMDNINSLLQSEFYVARGYYDRLIFSLTDLSDLGLTTKGQEILKKIYHEEMHFFNGKFYFDEEIEIPSFDKKTFLKEMKNIHQFFEKYLLLSFTSGKKIDLSAKFINLIYEHCNLLHSFILKESHFEVQYPRLLLAKEKAVPQFSEDLHRALEFFIDLEDIKELAEDKTLRNNVSFLDLAREEKYQYYLHKGHFAITEKKFEAAKDFFIKATNYHETAEILTLTAWAYSFLDDFEKAKNLCLKAIKKDPNYGPAFNDYGNYLLSEGMVIDSLKFFELAKRATNYQNREYPYINAGRAYMLLKKFNEALNEFSYALTLAPYHEELHETVKKLKDNLTRSPEMSLSN